MKIGDRARVDDFAWLERWRDEAAARYLAEETAFALERSTTSTDRTSLVSTILRTAAVPSSKMAPYREGEYLYEPRLERSPRREVLLRRRGVLEAPFELVIDRLQEGTRPGELVMTKDHSIVSYLADGKSTQLIRFREPAGAVELPDRLGPASALPVFVDPTQVFWVQTDARGRGFRVLRHRLRTEATEDYLVYEETDPTLDVSIRGARDGSYLFIRSRSPETSEVAMIPMSEPEREPRVLFGRQSGVRYDVEHRHDRFLLLIEGGAPNTRLFTLPESDPFEKFLEPLLEISREISIDRLEVVEDFAVLLGHKGPEPFVRLRELSNDILTRKAKDLEVSLFTGPHRAALVPMQAFRAKVLRFEIQSPLVPKALVDLDLATGTVKQVGAFGSEGFDASGFRIVSGKSSGGVPFTFVGPSKDKKPGPAVVVASCERGPRCAPGFDPRTVAWLQQGMAVLIAHARDDAEVNHVADHAVRTGLVASGHLALYGSELEGVMAARAAREKPEWYQALFLEDALVDPIGTLGGEATPWVLAARARLGNPRVGGVYEAMMSSSPYELLPSGVPVIVVFAEFEGFRERPFDVGKFVAKLRRDAPKVQVRAFFGASGPNGEDLRATAYSVVAEALTGRPDRSAL